MENTKWNIAERREAFKSVSRADFLEFTKKMRTNCWVQMSVEGNFYQAEAEKFFSTAIEILGGKYFTELENILLRRSIM